MRWGISMLLVLALVGSARADDNDANRDQAKALLRDGNAAYERGDYPAALKAFRQARQRFASPLIHYSIGLTLVKLDLPLGAIQELEAFLAEAKDASPERRDDAAAQIPRLEHKVGHLAISSPLAEARVSIDGELVGLTPLDRPVRVVPGDHHIELERTGYRSATAEVRVGAGETRETTLTPELEVAPANPGAPVRRHHRIAWYRDVWGWALVGGGAAAALVGVGFYAHASSLDGQGDREPDQGKAHRLYDSANSDRSIGVVGMGVGLAVLLAGGVKLAWPGDSVSVEAAPQTAWLRWQGRF